VQAVVVVANPDSHSFTHAIARRAEQGLRSAGHHTVVRDLYAEGFTAAMSPAERAAYHSSEPVLSAQVAEHIELVRSAEALVFVYPTWWSGLPAVGISTYGAPWWTVKTVNDNGRRVLMRTLRLSTGWGTNRHWLGLYRVEATDDAERQAFLDRVEREMSKL
jgi:putative NADPH-quinone reductase